MTEKKKTETKVEAAPEVVAATEETAPVVEVEAAADVTTQFVDADTQEAGGEDENKVVDRVVHISRVAKVVKGGRRFSFSALVVSGDGRGSVGFALGKANEVPDAIRKGSEKARRRMVTIPMVHQTIPHDVMGKFGAGKVMLKKASAGTGVIAGGAIRAIFESAGIHDILTKCIGTSNPHNAVRATFDGLSRLVSPASKKSDLLQAGN